MLNIILIIICLVFFSDFTDIFNAKFIENPELCAEAGGFVLGYFIVFCVFVRIAFESIVFIIKSFKIKNKCGENNGNNNS